VEEEAPPPPPPLPPPLWLAVVAASSPDLREIERTSESERERLTIGSPEDQERPKTNRGSFLSDE
jgi:hypothetical protein